jgi:hypothetical protein
MSSESRGRDDRLALAAVIAGGALAFYARRQPMLLGTGAALGLAGVFLALRGDRPISARGWLRAGLALAVLAVVASIGLEHYQEWVVGQWFAEGSYSRATSDELRRMTETAATLRISAFACSLATLLGAFLNRLK